MIEMLLFEDFSDNTSTATETKNFVEIEQALELTASKLKGGPSFNSHSHRRELHGCKESF